jgi:signal transduction histidine kinase/CheY-like chemotaxis protein
MRTPPTIRALFVLSFLLPAGILAAVNAERWTTMEHIARHDTVTTIDLLVQHVRHLLETQELILDLVENTVQTHSDEGVRATGVTFRLMSLAERLPQTLSIWVTNAGGEVVASSTPPPWEMNFTGRDDFEAQRNAPQPRHVGAPHAGAASNQPAFAMSRRRPSLDGRFAGALHVAIRPGYFAEALRTAKHDHGGSAGLFREDGLFLAREPELDGVRRLDPSGLLMRAIAAAPEAGLVEGASMLDGTNRLYAYRRIAPFPVYVGYGVDLPARVAAWQAALLRDAALALMAALLLGSATWFARRSLRERDAALAALGQETERRLATEARLAKARSLEMLGRMARGVAHDFNNMLTVVLGNLETLEETLADPAQRAMLRRARQGAEAGAGLAGSLLAYARTQVLRVEPVAVGRLLQEMRPILGDMAGPAVAVELVVAPGLPACLCDPAQLRAAVGNLVTNARDAMPAGGGRIRIALDAVTLGEADVAGTNARPGRFVAIAVADDGRGMPPEVAAQAFEPFFTTKQAGRSSGLGLSHVEGLMAQLGGRVRLSSEPGRGTTVTLELPATEAPLPAPPPGTIAARAVPPPPAARAVPPPPAAALGRPRILVVDDEPEIRVLAGRVLARAGYEVTTAAGAAEAEALAAEGGVGLLLSDIVMPGGVDGVTLLRRLRRDAPGMPALLMSGYAPDLGALQAAGAGFLAKPFTRKALLDAVEAALVPKRDCAGV